MKKILIVTMTVAFCLSLMAPARAQTQWSIGFTVSTIHPTNVAVHYTVSCVRGDLLRRVEREFIAQAPLTRNVTPTLTGASSCHILVRSWDIKPHVWHHNWPAPVVTTWVNS